MRSVVLLACAACGSVKGEAPMIDAPPVEIDAAPVVHRHYVVDHETIPTTNAQASMFALDLDGNGTPDNKLGGGTATITSLGTFDLQTPATVAVDDGDILTLVDFATTDLTTAASASLEILTGANPIPAACSSASDKVCRHHFAGNATFGIDPTVPREPPLTGAVAAGTFTSAVGTTPISVSIAPLGQSIRLDLVGARVQLVGANDNGVTSGILAGGVTQADIDAKILPSAQVAVTAVLAADCTGVPLPPTCGCVGTGSLLLGMFDTNQDCMVSVDELRNNATLGSLLSPDIMIDGQMVLSFGIGITAVHGEFTP